MAAYQLVVPLPTHSVWQTRARICPSSPLLEASSMPQSRKDELSRNIQMSLAGLEQRH